MTNKPVIQLLQALLGSLLYQHSKANAHRKECYGWRLHSDRAACVLKILLPYLRVKKDQALLAIAFREKWKDQRRGGGLKITLACLPQVVAEREKYCIEMHRLNSR